jgi:Na+-driven multidrug efflux pump
MWEIPLAYVLAIVFDRGPRGVYISVMLAYSTLAIVSALLFRKGRWKTRKV